ncbi:MAG TPA: iron ABC transporter permease [Acidobacteriota bacterium]|nr:iron ABC transporter permease [Acidobacteriota bacterium]
MKISEALSRSTFVFWLCGSILVCLASIVLAPLVGPTPVELREALFNTASMDREILIQTRLPRVFLAAVTGGGLAISGVVFQAVLRNPLASPFTLGVSGGSALGAVLAILLGLEIHFFGIGLLPLAAFAGAFSVVSLVYLLSRSAAHFSPLTLLLSGVVLNYLCAALIFLIHYYSDFTQSFLMMRWMMGSLDVLSYQVLGNLLPFLVIGLALVLSGGRYLNALSAGEDWAGSRGINVDRLITMQYFGASLITGSVIAYSGPIGFVGLIVPHLLRMVAGADHRLLLPVSFFGGATFLVLCDAISRTVMAPSEMPVGIITSLLGGPFFLWLLLKQRNTVRF